MTETGAGDDARSRDVTGQPPFVAIVDDDASVRTSARRLVRSFGYPAEVFASGRELLASPLVARAGCVLLDMRMPDMDGLEVQRQLIARGRRVPVVFISGRASDVEEERARAAGAVEFLRKPVDPAALRRILHTIHSQTGD